MSYFHCLNFLLVIYFLSNFIHHREQGVKIQWPDFYNQVIELIGPESGFQRETTEPLSAVFMVGLPAFLVAA